MRFQEGFGQRPPQEPAKGSRFESIEQTLVKFDPVATFVLEHDASRHQLDNTKRGKLLIIESRTFLRECLQRSIQSAFSIPVETLSSISELCDQPKIELLRLVVISLAEGNS